MIKKSAISQQKQWANKVKKRDNYTCKTCGGKDHLVAHHIKSYTKYVDLRYDINNGITLCNVCHKKVRKPVAKKPSANIPNDWKNLTPTGEKFGRWNVLNLQIREGKKYFLVCKCDCGVIRKVKKDDLKSGRSKSCGCWGKEEKSRLVSGINNPTYKHGCSLKSNWTKEYRAWVSMKTRILNSNVRVYDLYGGRGIKICPQWMDFECFLRDVGNAPSPLHELDRIHVDGDYEPKNCRWITRKGQMRNYRNNCLLSLNGQTKTAVEWSEVLGVSAKTIYSRKHYGWTDKKTLTEPVK